MLLLAACANPLNYRPVDLQLDLPALVPDEAETARICVAGVGEMSFGANLAGRFALAGIPADRANLNITVDLEDSDGEVLLQGYADQLSGYGVGDVDECADGCVPCTATGRFATPEEASWVLAVRFSG